MKRIAHIVLLFCALNTCAQPRITIIFVVDQYAYHYMETLGRHFQYGIKTLLNEGVNYTNAFMPHGSPSTATGHAALSTGAYAKDHGIVGNYWYDQENKKIDCCKSDSAQNAIFNPKTHAAYADGCSNNNLLTDTLSDQFVRAGTQKNPHRCYALSYKERAATLVCGNEGKAVWFDSHSGLFTTSKAYFPQFPAWLNSFNTHTNIHQLKSIFWTLAQPNNPAAYADHNPLTYQFTDMPQSIIGRSIPITSLHNAQNYTHKKPQKQFEAFLRSPHANGILFDLANACIDTTITKPHDHLLLWICVSSPDILIHHVGPNSREAIDMFYHLDRQLAVFMNRLNKKFKPEELLFVFTADHGVMPIAELLKQKGNTSARRILTKSLLARLNKAIEQEYGMPDAVYAYKNCQLYLNQPVFARASTKKQRAILDRLVELLKKEPGIKNAWTFDQLAASCFQADARENYFKNQLYPGRSGAITIYTQPYCVISDYPTGTSHQSPYDYDTHVPLILYQKGCIEKKKIAAKVLTIQLANTLADILDVPRLSASKCDALPGI